MTRFIGIRSNTRSPCGAAVGVLCLALAATVGCQRGESPKSKESPSDPTAKSDKGNERDTSDSTTKLTTAREVLAHMVEAYRNASSYSDMGTARRSVSVKDQTVPDLETKFSLAFVRPNKVRIQAYGSEIICDGTKLYGYVPFVPDQVVARPAPEQLTIRTILSDAILADALNEGFAGPSPLPMISGCPFHATLPVRGRSPLKEPLTNSRIFSPS